ncbi:DNA polymerase alpha subunit B [Coccinella septempunctata]|uniref:DNA polymerase alpha subunit B n=1 Tax=Coccinella septempunctata TaxID=41139 RepID=UPI001D081D32|nr:DNA polymerase alpha subunit B [Coccinella septempunctata]
MNLQDELVGCFEFINLKLETKVLKKCEDLCNKYDVEPEEFCNIWCAFAASTMCTDAPTLEKLEVVERKELQKLNKEKPFPKTPKTNRVENRNKGEENEDRSFNDMQGSHKFSNDEIENKNGVNAAELPGEEFIDELIESQLGSTQNATKYADRANALRPKLQVGKGEDFQIDTGKIVPISLYCQEKPLTSDVKYMYEVLGQKITCLNSVANWIGTNIAKRNNCLLHSDVVTKNYIGPIITHGRIFNDDEGQLNMQSIMLEGTGEVNYGQCVHLNIDKVPGTALFPGQIVVVKGKMLNGDKLIAENLYTDATCDLPPNPAVTEDPLRIIAAAGPFTLDENLNYDTMRDLLNYVSTKEPHVLILMGPFIDENHPIISKGDIAESFDVFFETLIESISVALQDTNIQIVVICSSKDVHHYKVYPTPPYKLREKYKNVKVFPDPCILRIDDLIVGATTTDIMYHIAKEEVVTTKNSETLARLPAHILQQRCFYPLYPPSNEVNVCYQFLESYGMMECLPHLLFLPSKFKTFAKNIQGCVVMNPERLTKGNTGGAFADITILPGTTPIVERLNCKILNI